MDKILGSCLTPVFSPLILVQASLFLHKLPLLTTKSKSTRITGLIFLAWFPSNFSNYRANSSLVRVSRETEWAHRLHHTWQGISLAASAAVSTRLAGDGQRHTLITLQRSGLLPEQFSVEQDDYHWLTHSLLFPSQYFPLCTGLLDVIISQI